VLWYIAEVKIARARALLPFFIRHARVFRARRFPRVTANTKMTEHAQLAGLCFRYITLKFVCQHDVVVENHGGLQCFALNAAMTSRFSSKRRVRARFSLIALIL